MSDARFKVGDIVRVKSLEEINCIRDNIEAIFVSNMEQFCGKMFQICHSATSGYGYRYDLDDADGWLYGESVLDPVLIVGGLVRIKTIEEIAKEYPEYVSFDDDTLMQECTLEHGFVNGMHKYSNMIVRVEDLTFKSSDPATSRVNLRLLDESIVGTILGTYRWDLYMLAHHEAEETRESQGSKEFDVVANIASSLKANARFKLIP